VRIGFDAKRLYNNFTGLGNYSRFIVSALADAYPHDDYILFTPRIKSNPETAPFQHNPHIQTILPPTWMSSLKLGSVWRSFLAGQAAAKAGVDVYHGLSHELPRNLPASIKRVVTVHDLIFLRYPQFYKPLDVKIYKAKVRHACRTADRIVAISQQTAQDIVAYLNIPAHKIDVVYQGTHPVFSTTYTPTELTAIRSKYNLPHEYILNVGTLEERKNAALIVEALALLPPDLRIPVVLVGKETSYLQQIRDTAHKHGVGNYIMPLHNVAFADLPAIYQQARVFVYPSVFEGFGIPLIEAIQSRIPVITSQDSCFSEAAGPHAIYINPHKPDELAAGLKKILSDTAFAESVVQSSRQYIEQFQPPVIARAMHHVYEKTFSGG
jgi:glycosyltransferase involved in cell wall biosynthesis